MKYYSFFLLSLGLTSCMSNNGLQYEAVSETNQYRLARVQKGMSEKQVLQIMHKPYNYETFEVGEDVYDVWFYVTRATGLDQTRMVPQNLTPLTFKNGVLVGTGYSWYYFAMKEQAAELAAKAPPAPKPKSQDEDDLEFEKALKSYPEKTPPAPAKTSFQESEQEEPKVAAAAPTRRLIKPWVATQATFSKVHLGMTEEEVTDILGPPSKYETFQIGDDLYDIWFYETGRRRKKEVTPLTFKNGTLVGMTSDSYQNIRQAAEKNSSPDGYTPEAEKMEEDESEQNFNYW